MCLLVPYAPLPSPSRPRLFSGHQVVCRDWSGYSRFIGGSVLVFTLFLSFSKEEGGSEAGRIGE